LDRAVLETSSDRYVIVEYIAEGGMGAIYLGKKIGVGGFEKEVVLKQLLPEFTREPKFIDLFLREARLSASLDHANIVRTVDLVTAGDDYFMVMEYVRGGDLRTLARRARRRGKRFSVQAGVFIGHELLEALAYAHTRTGPDGRPLGLIHRDVSPSNILLSGAGEVKLTDFGIAKASTHRSVFFKVKGKVGYMSPEQARGEQIDARTDLFSLGVVMYEVLVGERLFVGDLMSTASTIYSQPVAPPSQKRPELPADLDAVIIKALSLDPAGRFQSAAEFQEALSQVAYRNNLMCGASEMATHLKQVCGDDPQTWLKIETLPPSTEETHGTAILTGAVDSAMDDEDSFDDPASMRSQISSFPKKEFTSVIALAEPERPQRDWFDLSETQDSPERQRVSTSPELSPLEAGAPTPPATEDGAPTESFFDVESRRKTTVRGEPISTGRAPTGEQTLVRISDGPASARAATPTPLQEITQPRPSRSAAAAESASQSRKVPRQPRWPTPPGNKIGDTYAVPKERPLRLWPLVLILLLIGIGVALGVAFSGPELEVVDPVVAPPRAAVPVSPTVPAQPVAAPAAPAQPTR
jgi:serine/threonine-protein kinase